MLPMVSELYPCRAKEISLMLIVASVRVALKMMQVSGEADRVIASLSFGAVWLFQISNTAYLQYMQIHRID